MCGFLYRPDNSLCRRPDSRQQPTSAAMNIRHRQFALKAMRDLDKAVIWLLSVNVLEGKPLQPGTNAKFIDF
jgi:hypothetical protein